MEDVLLIFISFLSGIAGGAIYTRYWPMLEAARRKPEERLDGVKRYQRFKATK